MKVDLHVHTRFSKDSWSKIPEVLATAKRRDLDAIAITDHDTLDGYRAIDKVQSEVDVIPGVERTIPAGEHGLHIIGLYVRSLPPAESLRQMIDDVKKQDGRVIIPHPFRRGTGLLFHLNEGNITEDDAAYALEGADHIELINWKDPNPVIKRTIDFLQGHSYSIVAGSDSHVPETIGCVFTRFRDEKLSEASTACAYVSTPFPELPDLGPHIVGHDQISEKESAKRYLKTAIASVLNVIPGPEPNRTLNRIKHHVGKSRRSRKFEQQIGQCQLAEFARGPQNRITIKESVER